MPGLQNAALEKLIGRKITAVVTRESLFTEPPSNLCLVFGDLYFEFYGVIRSASMVDRGGAERAETYLSRFGGKIRTYCEGRSLASETAFK